MAAGDQPTRFGEANVVDWSSEVVVAWSSPDSPASAAFSVAYAAGFAPNLRELSLAVYGEGGRWVSIPERSIRVCLRFSRCQKRAYHDHLTVVGAIYTSVTGLIFRDGSRHRGRRVHGDMSIEKEVRVYDSQLTAAVESRAMDTGGRESSLQIEFGSDQQALRQTSLHNEGDKYNWSVGWPSVLHSCSQGGANGQDPWTLDRSRYNILGTAYAYVVYRGLKCELHHILVGIHGARHQVAGDQAAGDRRRGGGGDVVDLELGVVHDEVDEHAGAAATNRREIRGGPPSYLPETRSSVVPRPLHQAQGGPVLLHDHVGRPLLKDCRRRENDLADLPDLPHRHD
nr:hypothetical protein Iba_chr04aCG11260 [Ipomoea batatas]